MTDSISPHKNDIFLILFLWGRAASWRILPVNFRESDGDQKANKMNVETQIRFFPPCRVRNFFCLPWNESFSMGAVGPRDDLVSGACLSRDTRVPRTSPSQRRKKKHIMAAAKAVHVLPPTNQLRVLMTKIRNSETNMEVHGGFFSGLKK